MITFLISPLHLRKEVQGELKQTLEQYNASKEWKEIQSFLNKQATNTIAPISKTQAVSSNIQKDLLESKGLNPEIDFERISEEFQEQKKKNNKLNE